MKGINDRLQVIKKALENEPLIELALVYGSTARGDYRPDSDADIAVAGKKSSQSPHWLISLSELRSKQA